MTISLRRFALLNEPIFVNEQGRSPGLPIRSGAKARAVFRSRFAFYNSIRMWGWENMTKRQKDDTHEVSHRTSQFVMNLS